MIGSVCQGLISQAQFEILLSSSLHAILSGLDERCYKFDDAFGHQNGFGDVGVHAVDHVFDLIGNSNDVTQHEQQVNQGDGQENGQNCDANRKGEIKDVGGFHGGVD